MIKDSILVVKLKKYQILRTKHNFVITFWTYVVKIYLDFLNVA